MFEPRLVESSASTAILGGERPVTDDRIAVRFAPRMGSPLSHA